MGEFITQLIIEIIINIILASLFALLAFICSITGAAIIWLSFRGNKTFDEIEAETHHKMVGIGFYILVGGGTWCLYSLPFWL